MNTESNKPVQDDAGPEVESPDKISPAKALFCGNIIRSLFWPFPRVGADEEETLRMVLDSLDRFLEAREKTFVNGTQAACSQRNSYKVRGTSGCSA